MLKLRLHVGQVLSIGCFGDTQGWELLLQEKGVWRLDGEEAVPV